MRSGAQHLKRQSMLLIDFNTLSLKRQMSSIDAMLIDELSTVVVAFELPRVDNDALHPKQQLMLIGFSQPALGQQILSCDAMLN